MQNEHANKIASDRLTVTYLIIGLAVLIYVARLFSLQILQGNDYLAQAEANRLDEINIPAPRGVIYDRNGVQLVANIPSFRVSITPALLPDSEAEVQAIFKRISALTDVPFDTPVTEFSLPDAGCIDPDLNVGILKFIAIADTYDPYKSWPVACDLDETVARVLREEQVDMPGVQVEAVPIRNYTSGELTTQIIGYMGPIPASLEEYYANLGFVPARDRVGYAGIEVGPDGIYQDILAGRNGLKDVERDVAGQVLRDIGTFTQPQPGNSLRLSIDTRLQAAAEAALANRIEFINRYAGEERSPMGAVIAMNPQTGEILAMVSLPTYDNNRFLELYEQLLANERGGPLTNHAIASEFAPGSTFKLVTAIGALNEGVITPNQVLDDPGRITITNKYFPTDPGKAKDFVCWKEDGHGEVDFVHGIAWSCNVYFYKIGGGYPGQVEGGGLGVSGVNTYAPALGYGAPLGIDLPGEENGLIPDEDWKRINLGENWSTGDTYNTVVGQGFVGATPLQVLSSVSTIANGGKVMWPHLVTEVLDGEGNV
ncbi:MAG: penicillin-binding transpeptidase domain-containing protein, partial [Anaerolineales bacterium]